MIKALNCPGNKVAIYEESFLPQKEPKNCKSIGAPECHSHTM